MNQKTRDLVLERDAWSCLRCRQGITGRPYSLHHRKGRINNQPSNLITLCGSGSTGCHGYVHAHPWESYEQGWMIRRLGSDDPEMVPIKLDGGMVFLTDDGSAIFTKAAAS